MVMEGNHQTPLVNAMAKHQKGGLPLGLLFIPYLSLVHFPYNPLATALHSKLLVVTAPTQMKWKVAIICFICASEFTLCMVWSKVPFTRCCDMEMWVCICEHWAGLGTGGELQASFKVLEQHHSQWALRTRFLLYPCRTPRKQVCVWGFC